MVELIDTHAHLYADEFQSDREAMIERARKAGVKYILLPNIDEASVLPMKDLYATNPDYFGMMMGLHPCSVQLGFESFLNFIENELATGVYKAVGEIGMDLYWDKSTRELQEEAFVAQCKLALRFDLPIAVHSREATGALISLLKTMPQNPKGVFHCFSGSLNEANELLDMGFYLGIGGVLSFKNSGLREVLKELTVHRFILETDAPYLAPVPHRGKRNESAYVRIIADELAKSLNLSIEELAQLTSNNARALFKL